MDPTQWDRSDDDLWGSSRPWKSAVCPPASEAAKAAFTWRTVDEELEMPRCPTTPRWRTRAGPRHRNPGTNAGLQTEDLTMSSR